MTRNRLYLPTIHHSKKMSTYAGLVTPKNGTDSKSRVSIRNFSRTGTTTTSNNRRYWETEGRTAFQANCDSINNQRVLAKNDKNNDQQSDEISGT